MEYVETSPHYGAPGSRRRQWLDTALTITRHIYRGHRDNPNGGAQIVMRAVRPYAALPNVLEIDELVVLDRLRRALREKAA